jgi:carboxymethylenebutenolidase
MAGAAVRTGYPRIEPKVFDVGTPSGLVRAAEITLGGVPRGAVLVACEVSGLARDAPEVMNALAAHGYVSVAADLFSTNGTDAGVLQKVGALLGYISHQGWSAEQVGILGYGFGGRAALLAAAEFALGAALSVSPAGIAVPLSDGMPALARAVRPLQAPWLGMFGSRDQDAPPAVVREMGRLLDRQSPVYTELVRYPGVTGRFYRDSPEVAAHAASFDCWQRTVEWLDLRVLPRPTPLAEAWRARQPRTTTGAGVPIDGT